MSAASPLVAVDIGNTRIKLGLFESLDAASGKLPKPTRTLDAPPLDDPTAAPAIVAWLGKLAPADVPWYIGSVHRTRTAQLVEWLRSQSASRMMLLAARDLPLNVALPRPDMVGIDRLLGAVAVNRLRAVDTPAIVIDLGTAITVDAVSPAGAFTGGAILPGIGLAARGLHEFTDLLPLIGMDSLADPPPPLGTSTIEAMRSGLYWGAVGGVRQLIELLSHGWPVRPQVYLTGGAAALVAPLIAPQAVFEPSLVLGGIALTAQHLGSG